MKICHIVDELGMGGLEKTVIDIAVGLAGHEHEIWCLKKKGILAGVPERAGLTVREFGFKGGVLSGAIFRLAGALKDGHFDIVHSHGMYPYIWGQLAAHLAGIHKTIYHAQNIHYRLSIKDRLRLKILLSAATDIIAVSCAVKESLIKKIWIDPRRIELIYNSSPDLSAAMRSSPEEVRRSLGIRPADFVVGSIGRMERHKGHHILFEAIAKCLEKNRPCKCLIAGDGPERKNLESAAAIMGIAGSVIFTGRVSDISGIISVFDVAVQPSLFTEGLPLVLAEAASLSKPMIATDIGGNKEIVSQGVNGFIVPPDDSEAIAERLIYFMDDTSAVKRMGDESRSIWAEKFTQEEMLQKIDNLYKGGNKRS